MAPVTEQCFYLLYCNHCIIAIILISFCCCVKLAITRVPIILTVTFIYLHGKLPTAYGNLDNIQSIS